MRGTRSRLLLAVLAALLTAVGAAACTRTVAGTPAAASSAAFSAPPTAVAGSVRVGVPSLGTVQVPPPAASPGLLQPDVVADECLLDTAQVTALLGSPVRHPQQSVVRRDDGSRGSSCYAGPVDTAGPAAAVNVYRVRTGTPAGFVRAAGGRALRGAGAAAAVLDTDAGPALQVASARFVVTVVVAGSRPDDAAWRAAARAALAHLPP